MSISDRLDRMESDIPLAGRSPEMAQHFALDHGPQLVAALRAALDVCDDESLGDFGDPYYGDGVDDAQAAVRSAIAAAFGEAQP